MRRRSVWEIALGSGRRVAAYVGVAGAIGGILLGGGTTAQARSRRESARPASGGDATGFVQKIRWKTSSPVRGVTLLNGVCSDPSADPYWTVTIQAPVQGPLGGSVEEAEAGSVAWARRTEGSLRADGFDPRATVLRWPRYADDPRGVMGVRVRVGRFTTQAAATTEAAALSAAGFAPLVEWTGFELDGPRPAQIENLTSRAILRSGGSSIRILGINRLPGSAEDCGVPGFSPTSQPRQCRW